MNPYHTLGVPATATEQEIRKAHRQMAKKHHPDANGGNQERFIAIQAAYELLIDPDRRAYFDATGSSDFPSSSMEDARKTFADIVTSLVIKGAPDIPASIRKTLFANSQEHRSALTKLRSRLERIRESMQRIKRLDGATHCPVSGSLRAKESEHIQHIAHAEAALRFNENIESILAEYEFPAAPPHENHGRSSYSQWFQT
jgi:DnaJ-class molecular chaperone